LAATFGSGWSNRRLAAGKETVGDENCSVVEDEIEDLLLATGRRHRLDNVRESLALLATQDLVTGL
jgi:hypothetical protein